MNDWEDRDGGSNFPQTRWTLICQAKEGGEPTVFDALSGLCFSYWKPVYAYLRRSGKTPQDAEDLTQGFFADLLGRDFLASVDQERGKFRSFLLASLKNFLHKDWRQRSAQKRGSGQTVLSLDFEDAEYHLKGQLSDEMTPDLAFERQWVLSLLASVLDRLEVEYAKQGKGRLFELLKPGLTPEGQGRSLAEIGEELEMQEGAVKVAAHRLKKRYRKALKEEIERTIHEDDNVEAELGHLMGVFAGR